MGESSFGPRRCRDTRKPSANECPKVAFYRCKECRSLFPVTGGTCNEEKTILCCHQQATLLLPVVPEKAAGKLSFYYQITGGYNDNAVKVYWESQNNTAKPEWIYLKTFTGGYLKYVADSKCSPMVFALADTDAFAYCDEDPCLECVFRCKRGFVIYIYEEETGLVEIPLDKMNAHWESQKNH